MTALSYKNGVILWIVTIMAKSFIASETPKTGMNSNLPYFILHLGPPKSGTTTIQFFIQEPRAEKLLLQDHYALVPHLIIHNNVNRKLKKPKPSKGETATFEFTDEFVEAVKKIRKVPGLNVFGSSEYLFSLLPGQCEAWTRTFREDQKWNLQVVLTYRRLHSWLPSVWNQRYKSFFENGKVRKHKDWPGINGDYRILSLDYFLKTFYVKYVKTQKTKQTSLHPIPKGFNAWRNCSDGITIVNMHDSKVQVNDVVYVDNNFVTNFLCKAVKGADRTCSSLLSNSNHENNRRRRRLRENRSVNLNYDILAVHAYDSGLIGVDYNRMAVAKEIEKHVVFNGIDLPQKCPNSTVLGYIYEQSLESERWVLAHIERQNILDYVYGDIEIKALSPSQLLDFNTDWEKTLEDKKLCSVDVIKTLQQESWQEFFKNLIF